MKHAPPVLYPLLYPLSLIMRTAVGVRQGLYATGILQQQYLPRPVISIGNLSLGGEGKTPLVIHVIRQLRQVGVTPALLSRGYGRIHPKRTRVLAPGNEVPSPWKVLGDEPALIVRSAPYIWAGISELRYEAGCQILERDPKVVFVLDDGFQHRRLHRDLDIVVIDCMGSLQSNRLIPLGTLREPVGSLRRAHAVVLNIGPDGSRRASSIESLVRKVHPGAQVFHCRQEIDATVRFQDWQQSDSAPGTGIRVASAFLVAAIGNPRRFKRDVEASGIQIKGERFFRDHLQLSVREWHSCAEEAQARGAEAILTTAKDAIKLTYPPNYPVFVAYQGIRIFEDQAFRVLIEKALENQLEGH
jgi:tetraacyldisaccharide 4'-kinase